jgi:phospholipid/cholesterol/gamma-HCH transport system substrate-binding protein
MRARISAMRRRAPSLLVGLLAGVLVLSGCSVYDVSLPGGADTGKNPLKLTLMFRDVLDLVPQSTVKIDDVTVGKVKSIKLKGYVAEVAVEVPGDVKLPSNTTAQIRQTSLLGEKFIALDRPENPGSGTLSNNDVIGLDRTGRNPEVEEVLGALSLVLNGGGVGQLKTIFSELNNAFSGREDDVRSVLTQIRTFMGQLDQNKEAVVAALQNTSRLAVEIRKQDGTVKSALDDIPDALRSINGQRADLVKLLKALTRLSGVGVQVIKASKASTINSLRELAPVLEGFAKAGDNFPKSFQVFLTYPFVDAAVGRDPQVARNLHMGDFTNLSIDLDLNVSDLPKLPTGPVGDACKALRAQVIKGLQDSAIPEPAKSRLIQAARTAPCEALGDPTGALSTIVNQLCAVAKIPGVCTKGGLPTIPIPTITLGPVPQLPGIPGGLTGGLGGGGGLLPRAQLGKGYQAPTPLDPFHLAALGLDPGIGTMLFQGVAEVR